MDEARIESLGITPLNGELAQIAADQATAASCRRRSRAPRASACGCPSRSASARISATPTHYAVQVSQSGLGMPDRDYYLRTDGKFADTRKAYTTYIARLFALGNQPDPEGAAARIVSLETQAGRAAMGSRAQPRSQRHLQQDGRGVAAGLDAALRLAGVSVGAARRREGSSQRGDRPPARLPEGASMRSSRRFRSRRGRNT